MSRDWTLFERMEGAADQISKNAVEAAVRVVQTTGYLPDGAAVGLGAAPSRDCEIIPIIVRSFAVAALKSNDTEFELRYPPLRRGRRLATSA